MSDLVSRLLAEIEKAERLASAATRPPWRAIGLYQMAKGCRCGSCNEEEPWAHSIDVIDGPDNEDCFYPLHIGENDADFIVHNDPAAVLRRCAADRRMVEAVQRGIEGHPGPCTNEGFEQDDGCDLHIELWKNALPERVLVYLAAGYGISVEEETPG